MSSFSTKPNSAPLNAQEAAAPETLEKLRSSFPSAEKITVPRSPIFDGPRVEIDAYTSSRLDIETSKETLLRAIKSIRVDTYAWPLYHFGRDRGLTLPPSAKRFIEKMIDSPLVDPHAIATGQDAIKQLLGRENLIFHGCAALINIFGTLSCAPQDYVNETDYQVLPGAVNLLSRQLYFVGEIKIASYLLGKMPKVSGPVLERLTDLSKAFECVENSSLFFKLCSSYPSSEGLNPPRATFPSQCLDRVALDLWREIPRAKNKSKARSATFYGLTKALEGSAEWLKVMCGRELFQEGEERQVAHELLERVNRLHSLIEPHQMQWDDDPSAVNNELLVDEYQATWAPLVKFSELFSSRLLGELPAFDLNSFADELIYFLGVAQLANSRPEDKACFATVVGEQESIIRLNNYVDRTLFMNSQSSAPSPLTVNIDTARPTIIIGGENSAGKTTTGLSILRACLDTQSLLPVVATDASLVPRRQIIALFIEDGDSRPGLRRSAKPSGSYERFLTRLSAAIHGKGRFAIGKTSAILIDDSIRAFTSEKAALTLRCDILEHFSSLGTLSFFIEQSPDFATRMRELQITSGDAVHYSKRVRFLGAFVHEKADGTKTHSLLDDVIPGCSGEGVTEVHGLTKEQLSELRQRDPENTL